MYVYIYVCYHFIYFSFSPLALVISRLLFLGVALVVVFYSCVRACVVEVQTISCCDTRACGGEDCTA